MKSPVAHWGAREWRKNTDDLVPDPAHPQAFPSKYPMDLMGRIRVKLCAEDGNLVAYGFGGQRVALPAKSVGFVITVSAFRTGRSITHGRALLVLDDDEQILLRADGMWETYGEVQKVCHAAKAPGPKHVWSGSSRNSSWSSKNTARNGRTGRRPPRFAKAPGYVKLRTNPRGSTLRVLALIVLFLVVAAAEQQVTGSVWHGAPTANLISGGLFTLALPPLLLFLVLRVRRRRWRRAKQFVDDLTG